MSTIIKRLNRELGVDNYTIENSPVIKGGETIPEFDIFYNYKNQTIVVKIGNQYPFKPPISIICGSWSHERFGNIPLYVYKYIGFCSKKIKEGDCLYCKSMMCPDTWSPALTINKIIEQFIYLDTFLSNCVKLEFIFLNKLELPEDMVREIFSFLYVDFDF
jgi:ubiquitin-protein ligase